MYLFKVYSIELSVLCCFFHLAFVIHATHRFICENQIPVCSYSQCFKLCKEDDRENKHSANEHWSLATTWPKGRCTRRCHQLSDPIFRRSKQWVCFILSILIVRKDKPVSFNLHCFIVYHCFLLFRETEHGENDLQELRAATEKAMWVLIDLCYFSQTQLKSVWKMLV